MDRSEELNLSGNESEDDENENAATKFVKNKNTNFRLVNLLMLYPVALQRSNLISTREQLQHREVGAQDLLFVTVAAEFNDDVNSGGLAHQHEEFERRRINPEAPHVGFITAKKCYKLWEDLSKRYASAAKKWGISGTGNELSFWNFCRGDIDVLYLRMVLNASGDIALKTYCAEGSEIDGGLDTSAATPGAIIASSRTSIAQSERKKERKRTQWRRWRKPQTKWHELWRS
jgi:hypothetical protein